MGRRKIEIKAIKDDRNRSVTFLKRKGGLFKKAHELAVLCSVDVAVIIFGHNKKLYEFSSGNINDTLNRYSYVYQTYGGPHEHKGPEDFNGKKDGGSDDEDDEAGEDRHESHSPPQPSIMQHHLQNQPAFQHLGTPSASPPMPNGAFHRNGSPAPHQLSRPDSRTHFRQPSTHLVPPPPHHMQVHPQGSSQPQQQGFGYMQTPPMYAPQVPNGMQMRPQPGQPQQSQFAFGQPPSSVPPHHQQQQQYMAQQPVAPPQPQPVQQMQNAHEQDAQRRDSVPPANPVSRPEMRPPAPQIVTQSPPPVPAQQFSSPPLPQPKPLSSAAKTHSIFTPIDDSRSLLAMHWGTSNATSNKEEASPEVKTEQPAPRSLTIDTAVSGSKEVNGIGRPALKVQPPAAPTSNPAPTASQRNASQPATTSGGSGPSTFVAQPPSRTNSIGVGRPRLKVQIPSEHSDDEGSKNTAGSSPKGLATATLTPVREHGAVHLPPPSPSASALLSAGATGPPNPFARPAPPTSGANGFTSVPRNDLETPISALPSRFVADQLLPSPSGFYSDWGFGRESNMLPSPLAFPTPVVTTGPSFKEEDTDKKRKISEGSETSQEKRVKA